MKNTLAVIVPYRKREDHLKEFIPYMNSYLKNNIKNDFIIVVVEQSNEENFNRGTLINIGFDLIKNKCTYVSPHDVDLLPEEADYSIPENGPIHLAAYRSQKNYILEYNNFFGGVNLFLNADFIKINGFSNLYSGYGAEDDDLLMRCINVGLVPERRLGKYTSLHHDPLNLTIENRELYYGILKGINKNTQFLEGLNNLKYSVIDTKHIDYVHYFVNFENQKYDNI